MGYTDFRPGIHYTGMEVDLKGEANIRWSKNQYYASVKLMKDL
jgi:hypothetical protein